MKKLNSNSDILKNIDKNKKETKRTIDKKINLKKKYNINFLKTRTDTLIGLHDNNKLIIVGEYNFYGIYQQTNKLWIWASSIPGVDQ